jgi:TP901 family phage tail tape measure protein
MADAATLRLKIDASGAQAGAMGFDRASDRITQGARRAMLAITAYTTLAVKSYASFEEQMANVSTMLDAQTMHYMPRYGRAMKDMATASGEGTATLSTGLYNVLSASIEAEHAVSALDVAVRAAKAGLTDTATATYAITGILNAYGLEADRAAYVSDILFSTVKRGQTTFAQLAPVVGRVTAISSGAGIALEEVSAALSTVTRGGISTDEAVTGLRQAIISLQGRQEQAIKLARQHGIELSVEALQAEGLSGMLEKLSKLSESTIADMFKEVRARQTLSVLLKDQAGYVGDYEMAVDSAGRTQEAYAKMTDTLSHRFRRLWQVVKVGAVESIEPLDERIESMLDTLLSYEKQWRQFWKGVGESADEAISAWSNFSFVFASGFTEAFGKPEDLAAWTLALRQYNAEAGKWTQVGPGAMFRVPADMERFEQLWQHRRAGGLTNLPVGQLEIPGERLEYMQDMEARARYIGIMGHEP